MYVDNNIDSSYKYIADLNENYVILVKNANIDSNNTYNAYIQFFNPSTDFQFIRNYKPQLKNATNIDANLNYNGSTFIVYDSAVYTFSQNCVEIQRNDDFFSRPDFANIIIGVSSIVILTALVVNCVTSLVIKGGLFNND